MNDAAVGRVGDPRVAELLAEVGVPPADRSGVPDVVEGHDPVLQTPFPVGECAAATLAAGGVLAALLWAERTREVQEVAVSVERAAASLVSFALTAVTDGDGPPPRQTGPFTGLFRCRDDRWIHLHGEFPALAAGTARVLECAPDAGHDTVAARVGTFDAFTLEDELAQAGMCGAVARTAGEWARHPQGQAVAGLARVQVDKIGDAPPEPACDGRRPLGGVRVLDLSRVLAGPTNSTVLAMHGAEVLALHGPTLPNRPLFLLDTGVGKRSALLDLDQREGVRVLEALVRQTDVFSQGFRRGALARRGFGPEQLAELRPGIIYVSINCYGDAGPWSDRPGWEQLAQTATGLAAEQGTPAAPALVPAAACDYTTGYLAALGTLAALRRRSREGGSYHVKASLCQTAMWLEREARVPGSAAGLQPEPAWFQERHTPWGAVRRLRPALTMSATPPRWDLPSAPPGTHPPTWLPRSSPRA